MTQPKGMLMFMSLEMSKKPFLTCKPLVHIYEGGLHPWGQAGQSAGAPELRKLYFWRERTVLLYLEVLSNPLTLPSCILGEGLPSDSRALIGRVLGHRGLVWVQVKPSLFIC